MLVFDQLKKDDSQLRFLAAAVLCGLLVLAGGLWWVQVVSTGYYQEKLEIQSVRTVRIPAVRGSILDREGRALAENRPSYNVDLFLEDLSKKYQDAFDEMRARVKNSLIAQKEQKLGRKLSEREKKQLVIPRTNAIELARFKPSLRYQVTSNIVTDLSRLIQEPVVLTEKDFQRSYDKARVIPLAVLPNLSPMQLARFEEQNIRTPGMELDIQSIRHYESNRLAAHVLGYVNHNNQADEEERAYNFRLDDYMGVSGIEAMYDRELRGHAGAKSVVVNYLGYRQQETVLSPAEPGSNVVLTIDTDVQWAAERALQGAQANARGAVVVMDARNGDILAMASAPTFSPNHFVRHPDPDYWDSAGWDDAEIGIQKNRAMHENYHPGSIFKIVVGLAALELGVLNPEEEYDSPGAWPVPGRKPIGDPAKAGKFNFRRALARSSNCYFIYQGTKKGVLQKVVELGQRLHLGEKTGLIPWEESPGLFPTPRQISLRNWHPADTIYLSFGQGLLDVTPVQMAVMTAAVANGGKVLYPRLVSRLESQDGSAEPILFPEGRIRDNLGVSRRSLDIVRDAMREDVASTDGTGHSAAIPEWQVAGKTGTAEVEKNQKKDLDSQNTWFASFAPYENPRYVVVVTVEGGASGGITCAPVANKIYKALVDFERRNAGRTGTLAQSNR
jgi:penicillin-binding protein 2